MAHDAYNTEPSVSQLLSHVEKSAFGHQTCFLAMKIHVLWQQKKAAPKTPFVQLMTSMGVPHYGPSTTLECQYQCLHVPTGKGNVRLLISVSKKKTALRSY